MNETASYFLFCCNKQGFLNKTSNKEISSLLVTFPHSLFQTVSGFWSWGGKGIEKGGWPHFASPWKLSPPSGAA